MGASDLPQDYLAPGECVESGHPRIVEIASSLLSGARGEGERARRLFRWARDEIAYDVQSPFFLPEHYRASRVLERGRGYCVQKAVVLAALARAAGISARLVFADIRNHRTPPFMRQLMGTDLFVYHCYDELWLGGRWVKAVCSFDRALCQRHGYPLVEFDGEHDALFPARDLDGRRFMEYVRNHGARAEVPLPELLSGWHAAYGDARVAIWMAAFRP